MQRDNDKAFDLSSYGWVEKHKKVFNRKASLRYYYEVIGNILRKNLIPGCTLEIGSGPGFLSNVVEDVITSDIHNYTGVKVVCDAHNLTFKNQSFSNVFFFDALHHFSSPFNAFCEISRVLKPGGRLVMIEPFTTPLSRLFWKHVHHEDCYSPGNVWENAFAVKKDPMEGNAEIPRACLIENNSPVKGDCPDTGLRLYKIVPFACLSYLLTGGFQQWQFPLPLVKMLYQIEEKTQFLWSCLAAVRCLAVLERVSEGREWNEKH